MLPKAVFLSEEFSRLSPRAVKLLLFTHLQYTGRNNGQLCVTATGPHGFRSKDILFKARNELLATGWLQLTRRGGLHGASFYALTWEPIDSSEKYVYDAGIAAGPPSMLWRGQFANLRDAPPVPSGSKQGFASVKPPVRKRNVQPVARTTSSRSTDHVVPLHGPRKVARGP